MQIMYKGVLVSVSDQRLQFYKARIKEKLADIKDDLGPLRFKLYNAMVDECDDYEELREMAELEMQLELLDYTRNEITGRLLAEQINIADIKKAANNIDTSSKSIVYNQDDLEDDLEDPDIASAMAFLLAKRLAAEPIEEKNAIYEEGVPFGYYSGNPSDYKENDGDYLNIDEEELELNYLGPISETNEEESSLIEEDTEDDYFSSGNESEEEESDEDDDYFIDSEECDEESNEESAEDSDEEDDYFMTTENTSDTDEDDNLFIDEDEEDDYFSDTNSGTNNESVEDEDEEDDFFIETDEDEEELADESSDSEEDDDFFIETDEEDEGSVMEASEDEDDDFFIETDEEDEDTTSSDTNDTDDYFADDTFVEEEEETSLFDDSDDYFGEETTIKPQKNSVVQKNILPKHSRKTITHENVFDNNTARGAQTQKMFNWLNKAIDKTEKVVKDTTIKANQQARKVANTTMFSLQDNEDEDDIIELY